MRRITFHIMMAMTLITILVLQVVGSLVDGNAAPQVRNGVMDVRGWDFRSQGLVPLNGQWEFNWHELLSPAAATAPRKVTYYAPVPASWNQFQLQEGNRSGAGYATYRLHIMKDDIDSLYGVWLPSIYSSYQLWVNGRLVLNEGTVSEDENTYEPSTRRRMAMFHMPGEQAEIVIQVANYSHQRGGIWQSPYFGLAEQTIRKSKMETVRDSILFGCLLMVGLYHIGLFIERRKDRYTVLFGVLCIAMAFRIVTSGDMLLLSWLPMLSWSINTRIEYILMLIAAMTGVGYIRYLFTEDADACLRTYRFLIGAGSLLIGMTVSLPTSVFTSFLSGYQLYIVAVVLYIFAMNFRAVHHHRLGAYTALIGFAVLSVLVLNDILYSHELAPIRDLAPIGLVVCIFLQSLVISLRYSQVLTDLESVSTELIELNASLEQRIQKRTAELVHMNAHLEKNNKELERMEISRRHLFTNISHDLRTPITLIRGYLEVLQDEIVYDKAEQKKYIRLMLNKINSLNHLIGDMFELSKLEAGQVQFSKQEVLLEHFITHLEDNYKLELSGKGLIFTCYNETYRDVPPASIVLKVDLDRMTQVFDNLIYNAVKFTPAGGSITIRIQYTAEKETIHIEVTDTGIGVREEDLPFIFDRFYKKDKSRNSSTGGSGIGLAIAKEVIELHSGQIGVESGQGAGTTFHIVLPAYRISSPQR